MKKLRDFTKRMLKLIENLSYRIAVYFEGQDLPFFISKISCVFISHSESLTLSTQEAVNLKIIPARDPKQCQNKNNEGSWYHGPIITHIAPHLSSVLRPDAAERRKVRELPRKHRIDRFTTDQNEHVCAVYIMQFTVVISRTRTNMFALYIACNLQSWYHGPCLFSI